MTLTLTNVLLVFAAICFLLGAVGVVARVNMVALWLLFWLLAQSLR